MSYQWIMYDPLTGVEDEFTDYDAFILKVREYSILEVDINAPPPEEGTYLWVKILPPDCDAKNSPWLRINKMLYLEPYFDNLTKFNKGQLHPCKILDRQAMDKFYPKRHTGSLYMTAMSKFELIADEENEVSSNLADTYEIDYELREGDIAYPRTVGFDVALSTAQLNTAIIYLNKVLQADNKVDSKVDSKADNKNKLIEHNSFKQALVTVCFFITEAARFELVQKAAMNMLSNIDNIDAKSYASWDRWKPLIQNWGVFSEKLDANGQRGVKPELLLGLPVAITNHGIKGLPAFQNTNRQNVLKFFSSDQDIIIIQRDVMKDFYKNYPEYILVERESAFESAFENSAQIKII